VPADAVSYWRRVRQRRKNSSELVSPSLDVRAEGVDGSLLWRFSLSAVLSACCTLAMRWKKAAAILMFVVVEPSSSCAAHANESTLWKSAGVSIPRRIVASTAMAASRSWIRGGMRSACTLPARARWIARGTILSHATESTEVAMDGRRRLMALAMTGTAAGASRTWCKAPTRMVSTSAVGRLLAPDDRSATAMRVR